MTLDDVSKSVMDLTEFLKDKEITTSNKTEYHSYIECNAEKEI